MNNAQKQKEKAAGLKSFACAFGAMARAPGGIEREHAVGAAETTLAGMRSSIDEYIALEFDRLNRVVAALGNGCSSPADADTLYRPVCGLRDVGSTAGFELLTEIARNFCDLLEAVQAGAQCGQDVVDCHVAALHVARQECHRGTGLKGAEELVAGLKTILHRFVPPES
ncbi:MAG: hypothetical protein FJX62_01020 [Alphaproteobacteria bacterium]|nr:hypothetical protein [Alphaproteobacteria bacterium]